MLLTKFGKNRIKHEEEEANCEKERKKEKNLLTPVIPNRNLSQKVLKRGQPDAYA